jgi:hypothetical protein
MFLYSKHEGNKASGDRRLAVSWLWKLSGLAGLLALSLTTTPQLRVPSSLPLRRPQLTAQHLVTEGSVIKQTTEEGRMGRWPNSPSVTWIVLTAEPRVCRAAPLTLDFSTRTASPPLSQPHSWAR